MVRSLVLASLAVLAASCGGDTSTGIVATCPPESTSLTYANYGQAVILEQCLACHATKESPLLTTLDDVRLHRAQIIRAAVETTAMPEDTDMSLEERRLLGEWLACGAP